MTNLQEHWETTAEKWQQEQRHLLWRQHSDAVNLELLKKWLPDSPVNNVLKTDLFDEAFGKGLYPFMELNAESVYGVDISKAVIDSACKKYPKLQAETADVRCLPFGNETIDLIISNSTLDHFQDTKEISVALDELYRVLRPGGQMVLTLDNLRNPVIALRHILPYRLLNSLGLVPYLVGSTFGPGGLHKKVSDTGFSVTDTTFLMHCPRVFAVAIAGLLQRRAKRPVQQRFLRSLMVFEKLSRWPTRSFSGHFTAMRLVK